MEKYPTVRIIHGRRKNLPADKELTVEVEISFEKKRKWLSTGVRVLQKNWKNGKNVVGRADSIDLNLQIEHTVNTINRYIRKLMIEGKPFTWTGLDKELAIKNRATGFIDFVKDRVFTRKDIRESTRRNHRKFYNALVEYGKIKSFDDLQRKAVADYDKWLRARKEYRQATIASYHKYLKVYINEAIKLEMVSKSPYEGFKVEKGKPGLRKFLTNEELSAIQTAKMPTESLERVRDMFVFQCYTGLSYTDMKQFDFNKVIKRNDKYIINDIRQKTGSDFYIVLMPICLAILEKYNYKLPVLTNEQYNLRLKLVAMYAGLHKNLTSHMGRHTYATMCVNAGVPLAVLAKMLGHSRIETTQIYAKILNTTVEDAYSLLENKLSNK